MGTLEDTERPYSACMAHKEDDIFDCPICGFYERVAGLTDTFAILDALLSESRKVANADAGTVYLVANGRLIFSAAQNDTLFPASAANKYAYLNESLAMDSESLAGYAAATGKNVNIADVYTLPPESVYKFNSLLDKKTGYRSKSVLALPLKNSRGKTIGVLQMINNRDADAEGAFSEAKKKLLAHMARMVTIPLEKSFLFISMIMRMLRTSALRDPNETARHVQRVGSVAAELYQRWAENRNIDPDEILIKKGRLRLAAMLHDIGKVGIPDAILKKPGELDEREKAIMRTHPSLGASLFDADNEIDAMAREIALHHHAKWDGSGYTGSPDIASPKGEEIPIWARIVSIADVYDALVSRRCYKDAWPVEKALEILRKEAGKSFDPELVEIFVNMQDLVQTIYERYMEAGEDKSALPALTS